MRILVTIMTNMDYNASMRSLEYHTFWPACQKLGEAMLLPFDLEDQAGLNRRFLQMLREFEPDLVFTVPFTNQWLDGTMESAKCPTVAWICDSYRRDYVSQEIPRYSHIVGTDEKTCEMALSQGKLFRMSTWACNPDFHVPGPQRDLDIVWIGQNSAWRRDYVRALQEHFGDRIIVRGHKFPEGPVTWEEYVDLLGRAKIGLSFSMDMSGEPQAKLRPFEVAACGALLLAEKPNYLGGYLREDVEYIAFTDERGLITKCEYFLHDREKREAIARSGRRRTIVEHTFENRLREVFKWALSTQG